MKLKKHGNEYSQAEEIAKDHFFEAAKCTADMLADFDQRGLEKGPALGGALTQIITYLIAVSPDTPSAMGLLSSCITNAAQHAESFVENPKQISLHIH
jgi:hypothetical protein